MMLPESWLGWVGWVGSSIRSRLSDWRIDVGGRREGAHLVSAPRRRPQITTTSITSRQASSIPPVAMAEVAVDPLDLVLQHASNLDAIAYTNEAGEAAADLLSSTFIHFPSQSSTPLARSLLTRALRSRNSAVLSQDSTSTPDSPDDATHADDFLPLDALIFILQTQNEASGLYTLKANREKVARVDSLDRPSLLDFLLGKKTECEVVLSKAECAARDARRPSREAAGAAAAATTTTTVQDASAPVVSGAEASSSAVALHPLLASGKRPYNPSKQDQAFVKRLRASEVVLRDRAWAFRCAVTRAGDDDDDEELNLDGSTKGVTRSASSSKEIDFTPLRRSVAGRIQAARSGSSSSSSSRPSAAAPTSSNTTTSNLGRSAKHRRLDPIVILPSSPSSLLTLANIKRFLEEGHYDPPSATNSLAPMGGSNEVVVINRPKGGRFLAVDSLDALTRLGARGSGTTGQDADPWNRVVCVITTGQKWQFKGYRWEEGRDLFRNVFGVYPRWSNEARNMNVKEWNVLDLQIDANKRHHDAQVSGAFWRRLEEWVQRRRPELA